MDIDSIPLLSHLNHSPRLHLTLLPDASSVSRPNLLSNALHRPGAGADTDYAPQGRNRESNTTIHTRLLQSHLCCQESFRGVAPGDRLIPVKSVSQDSQIQDGDHAINSAGTSGQSMGCDNRLVRCLFPRADPHQGSSIPQICVQQSGVPVQGPALWSSDGAILFHLDTSSFRPFSEVSGNYDSRVLGRLAHSPPRPTRTSTSSENCPTSSYQSRISNQYGQISHNTYASGGLSRSRSQSAQTTPASTFGEVPRSTTNDSENSQLFPQTSLRMEYSTRQTHLSGKVHCSRSAPLSSTSMASQALLDLRLGSRPRSQDSPDLRHIISPQVVAGYSYTPPRYSFPKPHTNHAIVYGRQPPRLGSTFTGTNSVWSMDVPRKASTYQCARNASGLAGPVSFQPVTQRPDSTDSHRQCHSPGTPKEPGRNKESTPLSTYTKLFPDNSQSEFDLCLQTCAGSTQHPSRPALTTMSNSPDRVDDQAGGTGLHLDYLAQSTGGRICDMSEPQATSLLLTSSGSSSTSSRCPSPVLGGPKPLYVSAIPSAHADSKATTKSSTLRNSANSSMESKCKLVPSTPHSTSKTKCSRTTSSAAKRRSTLSTFVRRAHGQRPIPQASRVETIANCLRKRHVSSQVIDMILQNKAKNTELVYDGKWTVFAKWCANKAILPTKVSSEQLAEFLQFLINKSNPAFSTFQGYLSAIKSVLKHCKRGYVVSSSIIKELAQFVRRNKKSRAVQPPKWNLAFVLHKLNSPPFEPLQEAELKYLTWKTAFLTILGTACRRSELHALDFKTIRRAKDWSFVDLTTLPEFKAKYQFLDSDPSAPRSYTIKALQTQEEEDRFSCPVRALRIYLRRTKARRQQNRRLFLPVSETSQDITANTVSHWIKQTLLLAYKSSGNFNQDDQTRRLFRISEEERENFTRPAHEIRALSSSYAFISRHHTLSSILKACYWRSHSVFTHFYLREVSVEDAQELMHLAAHILPGSQGPYPPSER